MKDREKMKTIRQMTVAIATNIIILYVLHMIS